MSRNSDENNDPNRNAFESNNRLPNCMTAIVTTGNRHVLNDITNNVTVAPPRGPRGRPRLSSQPVANVTVNNNVTVAPQRRRGRPPLSTRPSNSNQTSQPHQTFDPHVGTTSSLTNPYLLNRYFTPTANLSSGPTANLSSGSSQLTTLSNEASTVINILDTVPPSRRPGRPRSQANVMPALRNVRPRYTPNNDVHNTSPTPAPAIMLSSVIVVDNDGNAVHQTQSSSLRNHSNPTTVINHANVMNTSSSTRDTSPSTNFGETDTDLDTDVYRLARQHRRMRQMARDRFRESSIQPVTLRLIGTRQHNSRQYNLPTASEVAALIPGDGNPTDTRDVIVEERGKTLHKAGRLFHTYCVDAYAAVLDHDLDCSYRATMSIRYHHVSDLHPNLTDKWTVNVMAARVWTTYNPNNNRVLSMDLIIVDERSTSIHAKIPASLINRFGNRIKEGCVYRIHKFTVVNYGDTKYRPLDIKFFVQFGYTTDIQPSSLRPQLFDRYVFKFVPFGNLQRRIGNDTYLTDVIGVLREWGPLQNNVERVQGCNPQVRKIVIADMSDIKLNISLWGKSALMYEDNIIESKTNTNIVVVLTCCRVRLYAGAPQLTTTVSTQFHLNLPIAETLAYAQRYKLVIKVRDNGEDIDCVLFNSAATEILGLTVEELITKTLKEGAGDPNWIVDYFVDNLFTQLVVLEIKIDKFNLPPTYVKRYTVTKYYSSNFNDLNNRRGSSSMSGSVTRLTNSNVSSELNYSDMVDYAIDYENLGTTITEDEEKLMDEIEWNSVSEIVPPTTHTVTNQPPHAPNANMNDPVHDEVNATVVEAPVDDSVHDVSHASNELTIAVNTVVCPPSNATVVREIDEMPDEVNVNNMNFEVNEVAVPQPMEIMQDEGDEEVELKDWVTDVNGLGLVEHPNPVKLVGHCVEDNERETRRFLVYENMPYGSIEHHLYSKSGETLSWAMRLKVAQDTARALVYLHEEMDFQELKDWVTDVNGLGLVEHPNLVKLVGYCVEDNERAIQRFLVYENMPNGSIEHHLYSRSGETLSWTMRLKVAQDTARALVYLHEEMDFQNIFKDFKSPNILLDGQWNAKLSDFGLARLGPQGGLNPCIDYATWNGCLHGTREYVLIGNQSDTWNYGVFLYELITGKRPLDMKRPENEENLLEWVRPFIGSKRFQLIVDPRLEGNYSLKSAQKLSIIANKCLSKNPKSRPKMSEVLGMVNQLGFHHKQPVTHHFSKVWSQWLQLS
ncbi:protein kinase-like domain-containing protein [Artemisia annua]|uniref:Protein kinase-like domain-containing protein n=1 Tax=Artemisia annua TaxID=35608 RepID=A0A2U1N0H9_ARTAN|nr:protein kinase-like domain-containing protein [Artemisia annua]